MKEPVCIANRGVITQARNVPRCPRKRIALFAKLFLIALLSVLHGCYLGNYLSTSCNTARHETCKYYNFVSEIIVPLKSIAYIAHVLR